MTFWEANYLRNEMIAGGVLTPFIWSVLIHRTGTIFFWSYVALGADVLSLISMIWLSLLMPTIRELLQTEALSVVRNGPHYPVIEATLRSTLNLSIFIFIFSFFLLKFTNGGLFEVLFSFALTFCFLVFLARIFRVLWIYRRISFIANRMTAKLD